MEPDKIIAFVAALITIWDKVKSLSGKPSKKDCIKELKLRSQIAHVVSIYLSGISQFKDAHDAALSVRERCNNIINLEPLIPKLKDTKFHQLVIDFEQQLAKLASSLNFSKHKGTPADINNLSTSNIGHIDQIDKIADQIGMITASLNNIQDLKDILNQTQFDAKILKKKTEDINQCIPEFHYNELRHISKKALGPARQILLSSDTVILSGFSILDSLKGELLEWTID